MAKRENWASIAARVEPDGDALRVEIEELRDDVDRLTVQRDRAVADARRYRWLIQQNPDAVACIAWKCKAACRYGDPTRAIDAAMRAETKERTHG